MYVCTSVCMYYVCMCVCVRACQDAQERNALYYAMGNPTEKSRWEILRLLLDRGCSASEAGTGTRKVEHWDVALGFSKVDSFGRPALYYAVQAGQVCWSRSPGCQSRKRRGPGRRRDAPAGGGPGATQAGLKP